MTNDMVEKCYKHKHYLKYVIKYLSHNYTVHHPPWMIKHHFYKSIASIHMHVGARIALWNYTFTKGKMVTHKTIQHLHTLIQNDKFESTILLWYGMQFAGILVKKQWHGLNAFNCNVGLYFFTKASQCEHPPNCSSRLLQKQLQWQSLGQNLSLRALELWTVFSCCAT